MGRTRLYLADPTMWGGSNYMGQVRLLWADPAIWGRSGYLGQIRQCGEDLAILGWIRLYGADPTILVGSGRTIPLKCFAIKLVVKFVKK